MVLTSSYLNGPAIPHINIWPQGYSNLWTFQLWKVFFFFSFALLLDCSFYYLPHILSQCSPMELRVIVGSDSGICTSDPSHMKEKGLFSLFTIQANKTQGIVEKFFIFLKQCERGPELKNGAYSFSKIYLYLLLVKKIPAFQVCVNNYCKRLSVGKWKFSSNSSHTRNIFVLSTVI